MSERKTFREEFYEETGFRWRPWKWFFSAIGIGLGLYLALLLIGAVTLPFRTASGVAEKVGDPNSVIYNYEHFFDLCTKARVFDTQISNKTRQIEDYDKRHPKGDEGEKYAAVPKRDRLATELDALRTGRVEVVETYNADSAKANRSLFKAGSLPLVLSDDPAVCN